MLKTFAAALIAASMLTAPTLAAGTAQTHPSHVTKTSVVKKAQHHHKVAGKSHVHKAVRHVHRGGHKAKHVRTAKVVRHSPKVSAN